MEWATEVFTQNNKEKQLIRCKLVIEKRMIEEVMDLANLISWNDSEKFQWKEYIKNK